MTTNSHLPLFRIALASLLIAIPLGLLLYIQTRAFVPSVGLIGILSIFNFLVFSLAYWWQARKESRFRNG